MKPTTMKLPFNLTICEDLLDMLNNRDLFNKRAEDRASALQYRLDGFDFFSLV